MYASQKKKKKRMRIQYGANYPETGSPQVLTFEYRYFLVVIFALFNYRKPYFWINSFIL